MALIGDSNVQLTEDILGTGRKYFPTYYEWLAENSEQVYKTIGSGGSYTVPENHILLIFNINVSGYSTSAAVSGYIGARTAQNVLLLVETKPGAAEASNLSADFSIPIKINSNENLYHFRSNAAGSFCFFGLLVKKTIIPNFFI